MGKTIFPRAVLFDLLTALLDSWTVWNSVAGSEAAGGMWRAEYLRLTYGCGAYVPYEQLVRTAARTAGLPDAAADALDERWVELVAWSGAQEAPGSTCRPPRPPSSPAPATTCSARAPWVCGLIGIIVSGSSVPPAPRLRISSRRPSTN